MVYLIALFASYVAVAAKAFQQLNVVHDHKLSAAFTSYLMAFFEIVIIGSVSTQFVMQGIAGLWLVIPIGTVGALGVITSMYVHKYFRERKK